MRRASHSDIGKRLRQAHGQLGAIPRMSEEWRPCLGLAPQSQAVERVVPSAKRALIQDHRPHCLGDAAARDQIGPKQALNEFKVLSKYL